MPAQTPSERALDDWIVDQLEQAPTPCDAQARRLSALLFAPAA
jgi:hypothetical protein